MIRMLAAIFLILTFAVHVFADELPPEGRWVAKSAVRLGDTLVPVNGKDAPYLGKAIRFSPHEADGPDIFTCRDAKFEWSVRPSDWFFQGFAETTEKATANARMLNLPDPAKSLSMNCATGIFDFHLQDDDTMLIMIDLVVYTFKRQR